MTEYGERNMKNEKNKLRKTRKSKKRKIIIAVTSIILCLIAAIAIFYFNIRGRIYNSYTPEKKQEDSYSEVQGITNILLIGTDGRTLDEPSRSDSIIIATIDNNSKKVKLTSIIRDTIVNVPGYGEQKINAAFFLGSIESDETEDEEIKLKGAEGGAALLMDTIEENFNIYLDKYVIVNFWGFEDIIDTIGGIDIDIKDYEIDEINKYMGESTELTSPLIESPGLQTLNGEQALSYARIRAVGNGGYERAERQNAVISEATKKLKTISPLKYVKLANTVANYVKTNIDIPFALNLAYTIYQMPSLNIEQLHTAQPELIVRDYYYKDLGWSLLLDLEQVSEIMYEFIFNDVTPNSETYDLDRVAELAKQYEYEEQRYNEIYDINPTDYNEDYDPTPTPIIEEPVEEPVEEERDTPTEETPSVEPTLPAEPTTPEETTPEKPTTPEETTPSTGTTPSEGTIPSA